MGKYTYTASLVDESINILRRADQELSGTNAAVINAVNTILNARGADRLAFDFDDILDLTDIARDDIAAVTKEILNKQSEIEEYENAPWWKKLFASLGMAILKYIEGHAQAIEYIFDFAVSLAGFIGGLFNSEFKSACKEWAEKNIVDDWFTKQFTDENGMFKDINAYSTFAYNSTAANIIEFGGSLINTLGITAASTGLITTAHSLYRSFENLIEESNTKAIVTSTPIIAPKIKEIFDIETVEDPPSLRDDVPIEDDTISDPVPDGETGDDQFEHKEDDNNDDEVIKIGTGEEKVVQVLYGPPVINPETPEFPKEPVISGETVCPPGQLLYGAPPVQPEQPIQPEPIIGDEEIIKPGQVLYGPPPTDPTQDVPQAIDKLTGRDNETVVIPKATTSAEEEHISKKAAGSFGDLIGGTKSTPVSSKPLSSKDNTGEGKVGTPLASGVIAAGVAGWGTKTYIDKRNSSDKDEKDKEIDAEQWDEDAKDLTIDYEDGRLNDIDGDYLSPEDELAFID